MQKILTPTKNICSKDAFHYLSSTWHPQSHGQHHRVKQHTIVLGLESIRGWGPHWTWCQRRISLRAVLAMMSATAHLGSLCLHWQLQHNLGDTEPDKSNSAAPESCWAQLETGARILCPCEYYGPTLVQFNIFLQYFHHCPKRREGKLLPPKHSF